MHGIDILFTGDNFLRLLEGVWVTVKIALISIAISIVFGIIFGAIMTAKNKVVKAVCRVYLDVVRIMPPLVWLFLVFFGLTKAVGLNLSGETASVIVFSIWGIAETGDLVRGSLTSIPKHQFDSGYSLGMKKYQVYCYIILPQAFKRLVPNMINLSTRMIKTTALVSLIGVTEVLKVGKQIIDANRYVAPNGAFWVYGAIFLIYFLICFPLSVFSSVLEKRQKKE
ncbi:MAG: amino acid ABC transporter permease [Oscillospiraceae bacterium]